MPRPELVLQPSDAVFAVVHSAQQAALAALLRQDIITKDEGRYVAVDSLYREWVARKTF